MHHYAFRVKSCGPRSVPGLHSFAPSPFSVSFSVSVSVSFSVSFSFSFSFSFALAIAITYSPAFSLTHLPHPPPPPRAAYWTFVQEREYQPDEFTWSHSLWYTFTTMTTLGFGDFIPLSVGGKLVTFVSTVMGMGVDTLFTVSILQQISLSHYQEMSQNFLDRRWTDHACRDLAASYIQEFCQFNLYVAPRRAALIASLHPAPPRSVRLPRALSCTTLSRHATQSHPTAAPHRPAAATDRYAKHQEAFRRKRDNINVDPPKEYMAKKRKHQRRLMHLTRMRSSVRRQQLLFKNTVGDPVMDKLNIIYKNMFKQEAHLALEIGRIEEMAKKKERQEEEQILEELYAQLPENLRKQSNEKGYEKRSQSKRRSGMRISNEATDERGSRGSRSKNWLNVRRSIKMDNDQYMSELGSPGSGPNIARTTTLEGDEEEEEENESPEELSHRAILAGNEVRSGPAPRVRRELTQRACHPHHPHPPSPASPASPSPPPHHPLTTHTTRRACTTATTPLEGAVATRRVALASSTSWRRRPKPRASKRWRNWATLVE